MTSRSLSRRSAPAWDTTLLLVWLVVHHKARTSHLHQAHRGAMPQETARFTSSRTAARRSVATWRAGPSNRSLPEQENLQQVLGQMGAQSSSESSVPNDAFEDVFEESEDPIAVRNSFNF